MTLTATLQGQSCASHLNDASSEKLNNLSEITQLIAEGRVVGGNSKEGGGVQQASPRNGRNFQEAQGVDLKTGSVPGSYRFEG